MDAFVKAPDTGPMADRPSTDDVAALLAVAGEALSTGRWEEARDGFKATLEIEESGAALFGLALALWRLRDPVSSVRLQERAFGMFRREGDNENAFFTAMYLCLGYDMTFGNLSASRGWLGKAARVVEDCGLDALRGWVMLRSRDPSQRRPHCCWGEGSRSAGGGTRDQ